MYDFHYNFIKNNLMLNCYLLTQTGLLMKLSVKSFLNGKTCLTLVIIQKIQSFLMRLMKKLLAK